MLRGIFALIFAALLLVISACSTVNLSANYDAQAEKTVKYIMSSIPEPTVGTTGGEWAIIATARSLENVPEEYCEKYYNNLRAYLEEKDGVLSATKSTEYSRVILALSAIGRDPGDVGGVNLIAALGELDNVTKQGVNGAIYALLALDSGEYPEQIAPDATSPATREKLVEYILEQELPSGGWALYGSEPDPDITAEAVQALAKYRDDNSVAAAIERGLGILSACQMEDGGYKSWDEVNSKTTAQVILALTELGIDPRSDERFIKDRGWLGSALMSYFCDGGGFAHAPGGKADAMATDQCMAALAAMQRLEKEMNTFFDMTDRA